jgi:GNAT superfamily N-acetyltransferase
MTPRAACVIRPCAADDADTLVSLIRELAIYEKLEEHARARPDDIKRHLFGPRPFAEAVVAMVQAEAVGFALYFHTFSTFRGQPGIYLEDLFVRPEHRGRGIGRALLTHLAGLAVERGCGRLEWAVLDWNESAIGFYRSLGARPLDDWIVYRLDGDSLSRLAGSS